VLSMRNAFSQGTSPCPVEMKSQPRRARLVRSGEACLLAELTSLVEQDPCPGGLELVFVPSVVVGAEEQFVVPLARDEQTDQHIGFGAATIAAIGR
jgi:hypothetical protein